MKGKTGTIIIDDLTEEPFTAEQWNEWSKMLFIPSKDAKIIVGSFKFKMEGDKVEFSDFKIHRREGYDTENR